MPLIPPRADIGGVKELKVQPAPGPYRPPIQERAFREVFVKHQYPTGQIWTLGMHRRSLQRKLAKRPSPERDPSR